MKRSLSLKPLQLGGFLAVLRFRHLLKPYRTRLAALMVCRMLFILLGLLTPLLTKHLIDTAVAFRNWDALRQVAIALGSILIAAWLLSMWITYLSMYLEQMLTLFLRKAIQDKWQRLSIRYYQKWGTGEHLYKISNDVSTVVHMLLKVVPDLVILHLEFTLFLVIASRLSLTLTMYYVLAFPAMLLIEALHSRHTRPLQRDLRSVSGVVGNTVVQYAQGVVTAKLFLREKYLARKYMSELVQVVRLLMAKWRIDRTYMAAGWLCNTVWGWVVIMYGFALVIMGELTLGSLVALRLYLAALARPCQELAGLIQATMVGSVSAERLEEMLQAQEEQFMAAGGAVLLPAGAGRAIEFDGVTFGYEPNVPVLKEASVAFQNANLIGITGPSGSGKTTLVWLMARFHDPWSGRIRLNGKDTREMSVRQLRSALTVMPQETFILNGTIRENIAYGNPTASFEEVVRAAEQAGAHPFIEAFGDGYDTMVGGQRSVLSGGQRQRIALARAFLKNSPIWILDEGLNSLEESSRLDLVASLRELRDRMILIITHDPSVLRLCDTSFILTDGRIQLRNGDPVGGGGSRYLDSLGLKHCYEGDQAGGGAA